MFQETLKTQGAFRLVILRNASRYLSMIQILWITSEGYTKVVRQQRLAKTNNCTSETRIHQQTTKHRTSKTNQFNRNKNRTSKIPTQPVHKRQSNRRKHHHHPPFLINTVERNNATRASSGPHTHTHTHTQHTHT